MNIVYGGLLGAFLVGLLTPSRGTSCSVVVGMILSACLGLTFALQAPLFGQVYVAWPWWIVYGTVLSFAVGASVRSVAGQGGIHEQQ